ncbi:hypothetical protein HS125_20180 [bacterium]|nr:hypothetical protein [bacterium]
MGGSIRLCQEIVSGAPMAELPALLAEQLGQVEGSSERRVLGLGVVDERSVMPLSELAVSVKEHLKESGHGCRFLLPEGRAPRLPSATVGESRMLSRGGEFLLSERGQRIDVYQTRALQDYRGFSQRDYGRPERDMRRGMLPPKLALMMLNLADPEGGGMVVDPFCGAGGLLAEAVVHGWTAWGGDVDEQAIADARANLTWLSQARPELATRWKVRVADALTLTQILAPLSVRAIATEPYLGPPLSKRFSADRAKEEVERLRPLYAAFLGQARTVLEPGRRLVLTAPVWITSQAAVELTLAREIYLAGFSPAPCLPRAALYQRPDQRVARRVHCLVA